MTQYRVTDLNTMKEVQPGDTVTDFRGETAEFLSVTRGAEYNGTAKVSTKRAGDEFSRENYAQVFNLRVETFVRCPHCGNETLVDSGGYLVKHKYENRTCDGWGMSAERAKAASERLAAFAGTQTPATGEDASVANQAP